MRFTYELHAAGRHDCAIRLDSVRRELECINSEWTISVIDNRNGKTVNTIHNMDELEEWEEILARQIWLQGEDKEQTAAISEMPKCNVCGEPWKPFDPAETDITMKTLPDANLKTIAAVGKAPFQAVPAIAYVALGKAMQNGEDKYERFNWREAGATSSVFFNAMFRHLLDWYCGEDHADDSKVHHLAHLMAGCAIVLDAELYGKLNDDRDKEHIKLIKDMLEIIMKK